MSRSKKLKRCTKSRKLKSKRKLKTVSRPRKLKSKMKQNEFYCVSCRKKVKAANEDIKIKKDKRGRPRMVADCTKCPHKLYKYIKFDKEKSLKHKFGSR